MFINSHNTLAYIFILHNRKESRMASFLRNAAKKQILAFWKKVGAEYRESISHQKTWLSTAGLGAGVGAKYLFKMRQSGPETRTSNMPISAIYTIENQFFLFSGFEIFSNQER